MSAILSVSPRSNPRRAANLSLGADVLDAAKALGINVSQVCDAYLREVVRREQARRFHSEYADYIATYNQNLENEGLALEQWRSF
jgi:antitoxin CcdA